MAFSEVQVELEEVKPLMMQLRFYEGACWVQRKMKRGRV